MAAKRFRASQDSLLASTQRMLQLVAEDRSDPSVRLRRLVSVVVSDFPRALFKLQIMDAESRLRVVPEFVTPLLQSIVDRYRATLGSLDVRDARVPAGTNSLIEAGILSHEVIHLQEESEITSYFAAHFFRADRNRLGAVIRDDLRIREVLLLPVRPHELPFGVVSVSSASRIGYTEEIYWRSVAVAIEAVYRQSNQRLLDSLKTLTFARSEVPTILVDEDGVPLEVNRAATSLLGFREHAATLRHLGNLRPCLPARDTHADGCYDDSEFYLADAHGAEVACTIRTETVTDEEGRTLGAVIELQPTEDLATRSLKLTRRQREVARLIAEGRTSKEVAYELGLSVHTVNYHRAQIRERFAGDQMQGDLRTKVSRYFLGRR